MYELKKIGKVLTSKSVRAGLSSYEKRIYRAAVSQRLRNIDLEHCLLKSDQQKILKFGIFYAEYICTYRVIQEVGSIFSDVASIGHCEKEVRRTHSNAE